jgi:hypothetical protein
MGDSFKESFYEEEKPENSKSSTILKGNDRRWYSISISNSGNN